MKTSISLKYFFLAFISFNFLSCSIFDSDNAGTSTISYMWLSPTKDAYVSSSMPEFNGSGAFSLVCSHGQPNGEQRVYIEFFMPQLPDSTEVMEAYINVWEDSRTGQPGNLAIPISTAVSEWDPTTITWINQPNPPGPTSVGVQIGPFISEGMWRTSEDVKLIVQEHLDNPSSNHGWILDHSSANNFTRSFTAMNAPQGRSKLELGQCPRLLIKIKTKEPISGSDIGTVVSGSNELGTLYGFGTDIKIYEREIGANWPESWNIGTQ
jgi:hypothetical protein